LTTDTALSGSQTFRSLRYRNARVFFAGLLVSMVGTWLQITAMALLVYRLTGRATDLGITVALQFLPMLLLGAWAGAIADRRDKRTLTIVLQGGLALQAIVLGLLDLAGWVNVPVVWGLTLLLGVLNAFENPARRGLVTELVDKPDIANATSLNTAVMTGSRIFGPALAAVMVESVGTAWCFLLNGASFAAVLVSLLAIRRDEMYAAPLAAAGGQPVREALAFIRRRRRLLVTFIVLAVVSTFAFNYGVALPKLADANWGGESNFGLVLSVTSLGSLAGALLTARMSWVSMRWYLGNTVLLGVSGLGMAWSPNLAAALVWSLPLGAGGAAFVSGANGITQQDSPPDMRGRLLAFTAVAFLGSTPIGGPITGVIGDRLGAEWALAYGSVAALVTALVATVVLASGRRRDQPGSPGTEPSLDRRPRAAHGHGRFRIHRQPAAAAAATAASEPNPRTRG
jgi:MFS family permease